LALVATGARDASSVQTLLNGNKGLITAELWKRLINTAEYTPKPVAVYGVALEVSNHLPDRRLAALTHYRIGWFQFGQGNIDAAINSYLQSKSAFAAAQSKRDLIYILADLGTLYIYSSDYKQAKDYSQQSIAIAEEFNNSTAPSEWPDEYGIGTALSNLANISKREGEYDKALDYFQRSLELYKRIDAGNGKYTTQIIDGWADIGRTYSAQGDYVRALPYLDRAMSLARSSQNTNRIASTCNSLGILYTNQRDYSKAIDYFQQGLQLANQVNDRFKQASLLLNIAVAYQFQKQFQPALENFQKSLEVAKEINDREILIHVGEGVGAIYKEQGKYAEALESLDKSLALAKVIEDRTRIAELLWRKAEVQYAKGDFAAAVSLAVESSKIAGQLSLRNVSYLALTTLGRANRARREDTLAAEAFTRAINIIEGMRDRVAGLESQNQLFFEDKVGPYHEMVDLLLQSQDRKKTLEALDYAERAKARVLADALGGNRITLSQVMSKSEKDEEQRLNKDIVDLNVRIGAERIKRNPDNMQLATLTKQLQSARFRYEAFQNSIYASHPDLRIQVARIADFSLNDISQVINNETAVLAYVVTSSKTYLFVITRQSNGALDLRSYPIGINDRNLSLQAHEFRNMLAVQSPTFADTSRRLFNLLIAPAAAHLANKKVLCILPDGPLWNLPFQALRTRSDAYLLEGFAIYYAPSLTVLNELHARAKTRNVGQDSLLAFGNPLLTNEVASNVKAVYRGESLGPLPEAESEVKALEEIWRPAQREVFIGAQAQKKVFKDLASQYALIHLATHGILDDNNPLYSRLLMARSGSDRDDDGLLEAREIIQLRLNAKLVVLSACQTAEGRIGAGEGMVGMSWAFLIAGTQTLVASQWKVDSASTAILMINFHKRLKIQTAYSTKAAAMRQAALDVMKDARYKHPFFWAGFVMIGDGS
jgi:CHAT domain-containing protein/Tfp pilus assembly protein PilF